MKNKHTKYIFNLKHFLEAHHGMINRILLSYSTTDSPLTEKEYEKWYAETNKEFSVDIDMHHTRQKIEDFKELAPYLDKVVMTWDFFEKNSEKILMIDLY